MPARYELKKQFMASEKCITASRRQSTHVTDHPSPRKNERIPVDSYSAQNHNASASDFPSGPSWGPRPSGTPSCLPGPIATFLNGFDRANLELLHDPRRRGPRTRPESKPWRVSHPPYRPQVQVERFEVPSAYTRVAGENAATNHRQEPWTLGLFPAVPRGIE